MTNFKDKLLNLVVWDIFKMSLSQWYPIISWYWGSNRSEFLACRMFLQKTVQGHILSSSEVSKKKKKKIILPNKSLPI